MRRLEDRQRVGRYPGFADRLDIEDREKLAKKVACVARSKSI